MAEEKGKNLPAKEFATTLDILKGVDLVKSEDFDYLMEHKEQYQERLRTRSMFRSKFEMEASVLNNDVHPTPDSKYWQAIGEQAVMVEQLIQLSYENSKLQADIDIALAELERLEYKLKEAKGPEVNERAPWMAKKYEARIRKKKVEIEQLQLGDIMQRKQAKERMREVRDWEGLIENLEPQLEFGKEDFAAMHPKRYALRYRRKMLNYNALSNDERGNAVSHYQNMMDHPDNADLKKTLSDASALPMPQILSPVGQGEAAPEVAGKLPQTCGFDKKLRIMEQPAKSAQIEVEGREDLTKDPVVGKFYNRDVIRFLFGAPHRTPECLNVTNFSGIQIPAGCEANSEQPFGFSVADARNLIIKRALEEGFEYVYFIDDDVWAPANSLVQLYHHNADVAGGIYYRKYFPLETVGMYEDEQKRPVSLHGKYKMGDIIHNSLVLPSGLTLIRTSVFEKMIPDWRDHKETPMWYKTYNIKQRAQVTEDTYICQRFRDLGIDVITDTGVQGIHVDKQLGIFYGHPDIVKNNTVVEEWRPYFAL